MTVHSVFFIRTIFIRNKAEISQIYHYIELRNIVLQTDFRGLTMFKVVCRLTSSSDLKAMFSSSEAIAANPEIRISFRPRNRHSCQSEMIWFGLEIRTRPLGL